MNNQKEIKQQANELRKAGRFKEALQLYKQVVAETSDQYAEAGLLNCLRKLGMYSEAVPLADDLIGKYPDFLWCRYETIWTYIKGELDTLNDEEPLEKVIDVAEKIMSLNPDGLAVKKVVFKVLKAAKASNDWEIVDAWVTKLKPESLSEKPMTDNLGREGWSDQSLWYNYRIRSLIGIEKIQEALTLIDEIQERYPKQKKFYLRLKALSYYQSGKLTEAGEIYRKLCNRHKPDWWLLHEYAKVLKDIGNNEEALKLMYCASSSDAPLKSMVTLFADVGMLCKEMGKNEEGRAHFILCREIRKENQWSIPSTINDSISKLNKIIGTENEPLSLKEALKICRNEWNKALGKEKSSMFRPRDKRQKKIEITGKIDFGKSDRPYCFITDRNNETYFCLKSDLSHDITNGDDVIFNAIPSFDKKKNKESWKAVDVRKG